MTEFSILLALNLAALTLMFLYIRQRIRKALELDGLMEKLRTEVGELVRDLNQTTDRNITLVEDAMRALRDASAEADKKVVVLRRETERRSNENAVYDRLGRIRGGGYAASEEDTAPARPGVPMKPQPDYESVQEPPPPRPESRDPAVDKSTEYSREKPAESVPFVSFSSTPIRSKPPMKDEVIGLSRRGISSEFIAAKMGITVAEVDLIISLEEQKGLISREEGT